MLYVSNCVTIGIEPLVCHGFGSDLNCRKLNQVLRPNWHVCGLGLDQPITGTTLDE